jgi:hypothetical protein
VAFPSFIEKAEVILYWRLGMEFGVFGEGVDDNNAALDINFFGKYKVFRLILISVSLEVKG